MVDPAASRRWMFRGLFLATCACVMFIQMLPLRTTPALLPAPDLLFAVAAVLIMRRPAYVPVLLVVGVFFLADLLYLRPPGLWTAIVLVATEFLRRRSVAPTEFPFLVEFAVFSGVFTAMVAGNAVTQLVFGLTPPDLATLALHVLVTMAAYPFVIAFSHFILGIRRARPSDLKSGEAVI
ncbi:MAG: rod shape-determining protein MreD [Litoreibacter sp.]|nr:rod shape-determining protein MreD [Litoreibacter sp.]